MLWTFKYQFLYEHVFFISLGIVAQILIIMESEEYRFYFILSHFWRMFWALSWTFPIYISNSYCNS